MRRIGADHYRPRLVQVCTGPEDASQHDSFLPQCPITFRKVVIPTGYKGHHQADTSHRVLDEQTALRIRNALTPQDLLRRRIVRQKHLEILEEPIDFPCPRVFRSIEAGRRDAETLRVQSKAVEATIAMSFIANWMDVSRAGIDEKPAHRITQSLRRYSCQE